MAFSRTVTRLSFGAQVDAINGNQVHSKKFRGENVVTYIYIWTISSGPLPSCKWTVLIVNPFPLFLSSPTSNIFPLSPAPSPLTAFGSASHPTCSYRSPLLQSAPFTTPLTLIANPCHYHSPFPLYLIVGLILVQLRYTGLDPVTLIQTPPTSNISGTTHISPLPLLPGLDELQLAAADKSTNPDVVT